MTEHTIQYRFSDEWGGYWKEHPRHPLADWKSEVANDETRTGYWEWVMIRAENEPPPPLTQLAEQAE